jgi:hypothetical protein
MIPREDEVRALKIAQGKKALEQLRLLKNQNSNGQGSNPEKLVVLPSPFMSRVSRPPPRDRPRSVPNDRAGQAQWNSDTAKSVLGELRQPSKTALSDLTNAPSSSNDTGAESPAPVTNGVDGAKTSQDLAGCDTVSHLPATPEPQEPEPQEQLLSNGSLQISEPSRPIPLDQIPLEPKENSEQAPAADAVNTIHLALNLKTALNSLFYPGSICCRWYGVHLVRQSYSKIISHFIQYSAGGRNACGCYHGGS